jgi:hypothetical protein
LVFHRLQRQLHSAPRHFRCEHHAALATSTFLPVDTVVAIPTDCRELLPHSKIPNLSPVIFFVSYGLLAFTSLRRDPIRADGYDLDDGIASSILLTVRNSRMRHHCPHFRDLARRGGRLLPLTAKATDGFGASTTSPGQRPRHDSASHHAQSRSELGCYPPGNRF